MTLTLDDRAVLQGIDLLGPVTVRHTSGTLTLTRPMEIGVLAALALHSGTTVRSETLIDVLWPEDPPRTAAKTLQGYVKRVRSTLTQAGVELYHAASSGYVLEVPPGAIDAIQFESAAADARTAPDDATRARQLDEALALWRGDPFAGCDLEGLQPHREWLLRLRSGARTERAAALVRLGPSASVIADIRAHLVDEPTNELLWLHLAGALYLWGDPVASLSAISEARHELSERVGVTLGPVLSEFQRRVLAHDGVEECYWRLTGGTRPAMTVGSQTVQTPPAMALPRWAGALVGRDAVVTDIARLIDERGPIVSVVGPGGIGKTRSSVEAARHAELRCHGFVDLNSISTGAGLLLHLTGSLGVPDRDDPLAAIASHLDGQQCSLILDNVEQIPDASETIRSLSERCPSVVWIVTSQTELGLGQERVVRLGSIGLETDQQRLSPAAALLAAAAERRGITLPESSDAELEQIAASSGGIPLALELAAYQLKHLDPASLVTSLSDPLDTLVDPHPAIARHRSMRSCFQLGMGRLSPDAVDLFALLAGRPGPTRYDDLEAAWSRETTFPNAVGELVEAGFAVTMRDSLDHARIEQIPLVRTFGRTLPPPADVDALNGALDGAVFGRAMASITATPTSSVEPDLPDIRRLLQRGLDDATQLEPALQLAAVLIVYWWTFRVTEGRQWLDSLLDHAKDASPARPHAVHTAAFLDFYVGHIEVARQRLEGELSNDHAADPSAHARLLNLLAMIDAAEDDHETAGERATEAIRIAKEIGDDQTLSLALGNGGDVAAAAGDTELARERYLECIERLRRAGLEWLSAAPHARLGDLDLSAGELHSARMWLERSISLWLSRELGPGAPQTLAGLARLEIVEGNLELARTHLDTALATAERCGSRGEYPWVALGYAALAAAEDQPGAAAQLFALGVHHGPRSGRHVRRLVEAELAPFHERVVNDSNSRSFAEFAAATPLEDLPQVVADLLGR